MLCATSVVPFPLVVSLAELFRNDDLVLEFINLLSVFRSEASIEKANWIQTVNWEFINLTNYP